MATVSPSILAQTDRPVRAPQGPRQAVATLADDLTGAVAPEGLRADHVAAMRGALFSL